MVFGGYSWWASVATVSFSSSKTFLIDVYDIWNFPLRYRWC